MKTDSRHLISLLHALVDGDRYELRLLLERVNANSDKFIELLATHKITGYFYVLLRENDCLELFSDTYRSELESEYEKQKSGCEALLVLLCEINDQFTSDKIPFLLMKGFYLSTVFVGGMNWRHMFDLDLLVDPKDLGVAISSAQSIGLVHSSSMPLDPRDHKWGLHAIELTGGRFRKLDLHCTFRQLAGVKFDYQRVWSDSKTFKIKGRSIQTLGEHDLLVMLVLGVATDIQCGHHKLRKLWEVYLVIRKLDNTLNWEEFLQERSREGTLKLTLNMFSLCLFYLNISDNCRRLVEAMKRGQYQILIKDRAVAEKIFSRGVQNPLNRLFFSRLLPVSPIRYWFWWLFVYVPARLWNRQKS